MSQMKRKYREKTFAEVFVAGKMAELPANDEEFTIETREASPAHLLMKIESFPLLWELEYEKCKSKEFEAGGYKWRLIIHPNGVIKSGNDEEDHISVYLTIVETNSLSVGWEVNANFSIFLYNQVLDNYLCFQGKTRQFHAMKSQWGFSKLISKDSFRASGNGFLVGDNCVIGAEVAVIRSEHITQRVSVNEFDNLYKREWKISGISKLQEEWNSEEFTIGGHKWYIQLFPNGDIMEEGRSVSMFLVLAGAAHERVKADYCMRIKNQLNDQHHSQQASAWFKPSSSGWGWGWSAFIPLSDMRDSKKGFVVEDCCIVEIEISVKAVVRHVS